MLFIDIYPISSLLHLMKPDFNVLENQRTMQKVGLVLILYDGMKFNGGYRVTVKPEYCGNTLAGKYVTGYVDKSEMR